MFNNCNDIFFYYNHHITFIMQTQIEDGGKKCWKKVCTEEI